MMGSKFTSRGKLLCELAQPIGLNDENLENPYVVDDDNEKSYAVLRPVPIDMEMNDVYTATTNVSTGTCRRRLYQDLEDHEENVSLLPPKRPTLSNLPGDDQDNCLKKEIINRINVLKNLKIIDQKAGRISAARRKVRKIKILQHLLESCNRGDKVTVTDLPTVCTPRKDDLSENQNIKKIDNPSYSPIEKDFTESDDVPGVEEAVHCVNPDGSPPHILPFPCKTSNRKENYCIACKKLVKEFCKHFERMHKDTSEGKKLISLNNLADKNLRKKLKMQITETLRKKGNAEYSKENANNLFFKGNDATVIPVKRFNKHTAKQDNCVQCIHCLGFYNRRKFSRHLKTCTVYTSTVTSIEGSVSALTDHSLPVIQSVEGASEALVNEILLGMKPRKAKDTAMRDPLIMSYASEFYKTRRSSFQKAYVTRVIIDLAKVVLRMQEVAPTINSLEDCLTPEHFGLLVLSILKEGGYDEESGSVQVCGLGNRLRSHIKAAAETAKKNASAREYQEKSEAQSKRRKRLKHFLILLEEKWANEVGRLFDVAVKKSRSEKEPKLAAEEDILKTCQYITTNYRRVINNLDIEGQGTTAKQKSYNRVMDLLVTHIMCLIRRRPVDFKRAKNAHYEKMAQQEDLISEIKNSSSMKLSKQDLDLCDKFKIFYVPGKGWKEMVPIALTNLMKEALDAIQRNKPHVGITNDVLFTMAGNKPIDPRLSMQRVTKSLQLKKPLHMSGNGLRHHAGTFSKLHSTHPQYQDYLASALGHTLHIHKLHYEMPTSITQKLIVCPVLHKMTVSSEENMVSNNQNFSNSLQEEIRTREDYPDSPDPLPQETGRDQTPVKESSGCLLAGSEELDEINKDDESMDEVSDAKQIVRKRWSDEEKQCVYNQFGKEIIGGNFPPRHSINSFYLKNQHVFKSRSLVSLITFIHNKCSRKQKNVTPEAKKFLSTHRKFTNVPL